MNTLYYIYFKLPNFARIGILGKVINKVMSMFLKRLFDRTVPNHYLKTQEKAELGINTELRDKKYIVSLTSFPARIEDVWICIETILRQSFKPDAIILWLANEQFPEQKIPNSLEKLKARGLTIRFCDDLRSHKKYYYSMLEFPNDCVITLDDDLYFHKDIIKNLVDLHLMHPNEICTNRAHEIAFQNEKVLPYRKWNHNAKNILTPTHLLLPTGGAGTLYPPNSLDKSAFDKELILDLCFHADDIWLKLMAFLNDKKIVTNSFYNKDYFVIGQSQTIKLVSQNVFDGGNDKQFEKVCTHFKINPIKFLN